jgi:hypothetical protein
VYALERLLWPRALRKSLFGGNQGWTAVLIVLGGIRLVRRLTRVGDGVVYREQLQPGEFVVISHLPG